MLRLRLLLADLLGLCIEGAAIVVPAYLLYGVRYGRTAAVDGSEPAEAQIPGTDVLQLGPQALVPAAAALLLFAVTYEVWLEGRLRRLQRGPADRTPGAAEQVYVLAATLPRHSLWLRTVLWTACGALCGVWLLRHGLPESGLLPLLWLFSLNPLLCGTLHSLAYDRLLWSVPWRSLPRGPDPLRRFAARYAAELERAMLLMTALALLCTVGFTASIPFFLEQLQRAQRYLPGFLFLLLIAGYRYAAVSCRPINAYLREALQGDATVTAEKSAAAVSAFRAAQALPYRLGGAMVVAGVVVAIALLGIFRPLLDLPGQSLLLLMGVALSVTAAAALYAVIWHRATLRPLLGHLQGRGPFRPDEVPAPLSLTSKMVGAFGTLMLCICVLSLLWSFVQYQTLATRHIQRLARDRLDAILVKAGGAPLPRIVEQLGSGGECLVYLLPDGQDVAVVLGHPASMRAPTLRAADLPHLRRRSVEQIDLPQLGLLGEYQRVAGLGTLIVLFPNYLHPGFHGAGETSLRGQLLALLFFFAVLTFVSGGVVIIAAVDLLRPVRYLRRRATDMAAGDLLMPVVQAAVETDEVGRLTFAFEEMRRALSEKLRSSTQLNLQLEAEVARRTQELERRNEEVTGALTKLQLTRDEILRTEKLAIMGRIAAGVTSEINNPVNAMVTIPEPMAEELEELSRLSALLPLPRDKIQESLGELRQMVEVLLRGAQRAKDIVRATRVYVRPGDDRVALCDVNRELDEVLQLFSELPRQGTTLVRDYGEGAQVETLRSDLAQLLSSWLSRTAPRLRGAGQGGARLEVRTRRLRGGPAEEVEIVIADNGPVMAPAELSGIGDSGITARLGGRLEVYSGPGTGTTGHRTALTLRLPVKRAS